ncbi:MAG: hypothetical protein EOO96_03740, partial [Pedobacter sp.]
MKNNFLLLLLSAALLFACNSSKNDKAATDDSGKKATVKTELEENFYKRLEGTIAGKPVVMNLQRLHGEIEGNYFYEGSWLNLSIDTLIGKDS